MSILYYSVDRPLTPGSIPNNKRIVNVVNFDEKKYVEEIGRSAYGYIEAVSPIRDYEDYDLVVAKQLFPRDVERGDIINCKGIRVIVDEILFQDLYNSEDISRSYADIEFKDQNGKYRHWKSGLDGGYIEYYDDGNLMDDFAFDLEEIINECLRELQGNGIDTVNRLTYFRVAGGKAYLYSGCENFGFVDLNNCNPDEECFANLINGCLDMSDRKVEFISFPCNLVNGKMLLLNKEPKGVLVLMQKDEVIRVMNTMAIRVKDSTKTNGSDGNDVKLRIAKAYVKSSGNVKGIVSKLNNLEGSNNWIAVSQKDRKGNKFYGVNNLETGWKVLFV